MNQLQLILLALSPFVVKWIVGAVKRTQAIKLSDKKSTYLRLLVILLALGSSIGSAIVTGEEVDMVSIQTGVESLFVFLSSTGFYFLTKKKETA